jgi:hypothetical protein
MVATPISALLSIWGNSDDQVNVEEAISKRVAQINRDRNNNVDILRCLREDPLWLCRRVLGQKGLFCFNRCEKYTTYFFVEEGSILVQSGTKALTEDERRQVDVNPRSL